ncbi:MAG: T9SS type A sorting domain-containing protein [bacterium]
MKLSLPKLFLLIFALQICTASLITAQTGAYLGQTPPGQTPKLFVPANLSSTADWWWHGGLDFLSDGQELFLDIYCPAEGGIRLRYMKLVNGTWTTPVSSPISSPAPNTDASPSFFNDGNKVVFISSRPGGYYGGFWTSTRTGDNWSTPTSIYVPWKASYSSGWGMSISGNQTIYSQIIDNNSNTDFDIYQIRKVNGSYILPEKLDTTINSNYMDLGAFIDPDEKYIIFESNRPGGYGETDLYISFKNFNGTWTTAVNMGNSINTSGEEGTPYISADKKYLFFLATRNGVRNPYWVSTDIINSLNTDVKKNSNCSIDFNLYQNYPNPFNPETVISYNLPERKVVSIKIYDVLGKEVSTLIDKEQSAGTHKINFNASKLTSGVYFYQIISGKYKETKKMILLE